MPDTVLVNADIRTMSTAAPRAEAIAWRDNRILAVGRTAEVTAVAREEARRFDAGGRTVVPGFVDPHNHLLSTAESIAAVNVRSPGVSSVTELVETIARQAAVTPEGQWIRAFGMDDAKYPEGRVTRARLDEATDRHPVIIYHVSGHQAAVNSAALALAGISETVADPPGGSFLRDEGDRLSGMVTDAAMELMLPLAVDIGCHGPNFHTDLPAEYLLGWLADAAEHYLPAGVTTVCDPQVSRREMLVYRRARAAGVLPVRTVCMPLSHQLDALDSVGLAGPFGDDVLRLGPMKFYCDGTLLGGTAMFSTPYGEHGEYAGSCYWRPEELTDLLRRASRAGWQVAVHTQGDRAIGYTVEAITEAVRAGGDDPRPRIEHCGYPTAEQITRFADLNIIPINQPNFLHDSGTDFLRRLGTRRAHGLQPMRTELEAGLRPALSSDSFVSSLRPMETVANAVRRKTREGTDIGAEHALSVDEALRAHTLDAAYAVRMEDAIGSLEPGKLADIVMLDANLNNTDAAALRGVDSQMTVLNGRVVHQA